MTAEKHEEKEEKTQKSRARPGQHTLYIVRRGEGRVGGPPSLTEAGEK